VALETLAERFEGHPDPFYPWRLRFHLPRKGAPPTNILLSAARQFAMALRVGEALAKPNMNLTAAVYQISKQTGISESTLKNAYYAGKKKRRLSK